MKTTQGILMGRTVAQVETIFSKIRILSLAFAVGACTALPVTSFANLQCPNIKPTAILTGGDRTDPRRIRFQELKNMTGRWQASEDNTRYVDIELIKTKRLTKIRLTYFEYDRSTRLWVAQVADDVDYVNDQAIFHLPKNAVNERADIILSAFAEKNSVSPTLFISIARCDEHGHELMSAHPHDRPEVLRR